MVTYDLKRPQSNLYTALSCEELNLKIKEKIGINLSNQMWNLLYLVWKGEQLIVKGTIIKLEAVTYLAKGGRI